MRKQDVFGRKLNQSKPLYLLFIVFAIVISAYFLILAIRNSTMASLHAEQTHIQSQIDDLLTSGQTITYHEIDEIIPYLPSSFNQASLVNELTLVRDLSGLNLAENYQLSITDGADSPFTKSLPDTLKFVQISLSMKIADPELLLDYLDNLLDEDRLFYVDVVNVSFGSNNEAVVSMTIFTFYNDLNLG